MYKAYLRKATPKIYKQVSIAKYYWLGILASREYRGKSCPIYYYFFLMDFVGKRSRIEQEQAIVRLTLHVYVRT